MICIYIFIYMYMQMYVYICTFIHILSQEHFLLVF